MKFRRHLDGCHFLLIFLWVVLVWPRLPSLGIEISLSTGDHSDRDTGGLSLGGLVDLDSLEDEYWDCEGAGDGDKAGDGSARLEAGARVVPAMMGRQGLVSYARPWRGEASLLAASGARAGRRTGRGSAPASSWSPASGSAENTAELRATSW